MGVMTCPHCEEDIDTLIRTGEKKYSCGNCSMVIKYDDLDPHLDEFEVIDKRGDDDSGASDSSGMEEELPPPPGAGGDGGQQSNPDQSRSSGGDMTTKEREKIYQLGTSGLKEIKKERLKNWLSNSDGVGAQTEQRILMVFDRNESVHKNPHVLYNLLDDELKASASYINTMVEDIFGPEEEHADLLQSQGYTPWFDRGGSQGGGQMQTGFGGPMNATGNGRFNPGQQNQPQNQQPQGGQDIGDDSLSRDEAEMMMRQAMTQADNQDEKSALLDGLSDATDEAVREMATNVGGLAGTVQKVIDEALVSYARDNPEWVIENMGILQKVLGATDDATSPEEDGGNQSPEQDTKVDNALEGLSDMGNSHSPSTDQQTTSQEPESEPNESNPDLDEEYMEESDFTPGMGNSDPLSASPEDSKPKEDPKPEVKPTPGESEAKVSDQKREEFESEQNVDESSSSESEEKGEGFDEIFGEMAME